MKSFINKKFKESSMLKIFFIFVFFSNCFIAYCQDNRDTVLKTTITSMTPQYSEKEIDSLKWDIVSRGDRSSYLECRLAIWSRSNGNASVMYRDFFQYALIMAFVYEFAHYDVYTILSEYRKERGEKMSKDEVQLCIRCLSTGSLKGCTYCEQTKNQLLQVLNEFE